MNDKAGVRRKLKRSVGHKVPDYVWENQTVQTYVDDYLSAGDEELRKEEWTTLVEVVEDRLRLVEGAKAEALQGVQRGVPSGSRDSRGATLRRTGQGQKKLETGWFVGDRTTAMVQAMSELFALWGHQVPEVKEFREKVLGGRLLTADETHALISSHAARALPFAYFAHWGIPVVGHRAKVLDTGPRGEEGFNPVDDWMTLWVNPPGITKTVRYSRPREGDSHTWHAHKNGVTIPIVTDLPMEPRGDKHNPPWLWPGSVVDQIYDISELLGDTFDWPGSELGGRGRNERAAWFLLTGEAPDVRPIEAGWKPKLNKYLNPQWRIHLTIPPWLPEEEVLRAYRLLRGERPKGRKLPKTTRPLEVARFVWEQERLKGYREPSPWSVWYELWNEENPGHRFESYNNFRTYFFRGDAVVKELNFGWPEPRLGEPEDS